MIKLTGPNIEFKKSRFSNEDVFQVNIKELNGFKYQDYFLIENTGSENFTLKDIGVSCGCTTPSFEKLKELKPGESTRVDFIFNVDKTKVEPSTGIYTKYIYVKSTNENDKPVSLHINCRIRPDEG